MTTTQLTPDADTTSAVEQAIEAYLAQKPYSSRFKARNLVNSTPLQATTNEIAPTLSEMADNGELEKISYSAGASTYRPTDDSQFDEQSMSTDTNTNTDERGDVIDLSPEFWPSHIDREDVSTHLRRCIIQTAAIHDDWTQAEIAEHLDCAQDTVSRALKEYWPEHHTRRTADQPQDQEAEQ